MELKLNVYEGNEVVKTYTSDKFRLKTGTCEDILSLIDIDKFTSGLSDERLGIEILKILTKGFNKFNPMMKEIFIGLTDEEYRNTDIKEVAQVIISVVTFTISELFGVKKAKN